MVRALIAMLVLSSASRAAVVVVVNATEDERRFGVRHKPDGELQWVTLAAGEFRLVPVGKASELRTPLNGKDALFTLDPYHAYAFVADRAGSSAFRGVQTAVPMPKTDDVSNEPAAVATHTVKVKLYSDNADKRAQAVWEKALRERLAAASEVLSSQCGVKFEFAGAGEWKSEEAADMPAAFAHFEKAVPSKDTTLHIGYTSRPIKKDSELAYLRPPFGSHLLLKEDQPKTEGERIETLVHYLGEYLGAVRTADSNSALRVDLKDGRGALAKHRTVIDPLNVLAIRLWADEIAAGRPRVFEKLREPAKARLFVLYKTQASLHEAMKSDDTQAREYAASYVPGQAEEEPAKPVEPPPVVAVKPVDPPPVMPKPVEPPPPPPVVAVKPAEPPSKFTPLQRAVRTVVKSVVIRADDNAQLAATSPKKLANDALTAEYLKTAADVASGLEEELRVNAFLIGVGIALDHSPILRTNLLTRGFCAGIETEDEAKARVAVLGSPTIRTRRDLCQHYVVSMALVGLRGEEAAELAGIAKELADMKGDSGFSFVDLAADIAGVELAKKIKQHPIRLNYYAKGFKIDDHIPDLKGLAEGMNEKQFTERFRSSDDAKFKETIADIRARIAKLDGFNHSR